MTPWYGPQKTGRNTTMADTETIRESTLHFEAVLHSYYNNMKSQSGLIIKLLVHPEDVPPELLLHKATTRFQVAMAQIGDDEEPVVPSHIEKGKNVIAAANIICRDSNFQDFMEMWATSNDCLFEGRNFTHEEVTKVYLRQAIKVESFKELKENQTAQRFFNELRTDFEVKKLAGEV